MNSSLRKVTLLLAGLAILINCTAIAVAQQSDYESKRQRAMDLFEEQKFSDARVLLEELVKIKSDDAVIWERLGWSTMVVAASTKDAAQRKLGRDRARQAFERAKELGDNSNLLQTGLEAVSGPDPAEVKVSSNAQAEAVLREGEEAYSRGDLDAALAKYALALQLEPRFYEAALFAGDMEYKKANNSSDPKYRSDAIDRAGAWFAKAITINPDRETAYRYWGDALELQGRIEAARDKFVDAIIAEPYTQNPYMGLAQWGQRHKVAMGHPKIKPPNSTSTQGDKTTINIDPSTLNSNDGTSNWLLYDLTRMAWQKGDFSKNYPEEKTYRHSLKEEAAALRMVAEACAKDVKSGKVKALEQSLDSLVQLNNLGLLEAYILFAHPDAGIARDYAAYRAANRDKLKRYWLEVAIIRQ